MQFVFGMAKDMTVIQVANFFKDIPLREFSNDLTQKGLFKNELKDIGVSKKHIQKFLRLGILVEAQVHFETEHKTKKDCKFQTIKRFYRLDETKLLAFLKLHK